MYTEQEVLNIIKHKFQMQNFSPKTQLCVFLFFIFHFFCVLLYDIHFHKNNNNEILFTILPCVCRCMQVITATKLNQDNLKYIFE